MDDQMTLDPATLRAVADTVQIYCLRQNEILETYFSKMQSLSSEWEDDNTFSGMMEEIQQLTSQSKELFGQIYGTYPPVFRQRAEFIDARPGYSGGYGGSAVGGGTVGSTGGSGSAVASHTDLSGKIQIPAGLVGMADFGGLDPQISSTIVGCIMQTQELFPGLELNYVGSTQARNRAIQAELAEGYCEQIRACCPDWSDAEVLSYARQLAADATGNLVPEDGDFAVTMSGPGIYEKYSGITFNETMGKDVAVLSRNMAEIERSGFSAEGCFGAKAVMDHELGHAIDSLVGASEDPQIQSAYAAFSARSAQEQKEMLSGYAATNIHEFVAEAWMEYRNNPHCREGAAWVGQRMCQLWQERPGAEENPTGKRRVLRRGS